MGIGTGWAPSRRHDPSIISTAGPPPPKKELGKAQWSSENFENISQHSQTTKITAFFGPTSGKYQGAGRSHIYIGSRKAWELINLPHASVKLETYTLYSTRKNNSWMWWNYGEWARQMSSLHGLPLESLHGDIENVLMESAYPAYLPLSQNCMALVERSIDQHEWADCPAWYAYGQHLTHWMPL